jgi:hypothetical protein
MRTRFVLLVLALLTVSVGLAAADDPLVGTWKLNAAKSKFSPPPPPQDTTIKYEPNGANGIKVTAEITDSKGQKTVTAYSGNFDGKDVTVTGSADADTCSMRRIDANTTEVANKKAGKATTTLRRAVSKDGKTLTITAKGTDGQGRRVNSVEVFDKQ